jgi:hypothetical protein
MLDTKVPANKAVDDKVGGVRLGVVYCKGSEQRKEDTGYTYTGTRDTRVTQ